MKIVITDGITLNPGDLDWSPIENLGETIIYDRTSREEIIDRCKEADVLLVNKTPLDAHTIEQLPNLKYIGVMATGYNTIDINACSQQNIIVSNVRDYGTHAVAQHTFALILELTNQVGLHNQKVHEGAWSNQPDFCFWEKPLTALFNKTLGIIGLGEIGSKVAKIAMSFGMNVISYHKHPERDYFEGIHFVTLSKLLSESDILSLHCPLNEGNEELIKQSTLSRMKKSAFLINTSRGGLINEKDLAEGLNSDMIAGAALDVLTEEPPKPDNPLLKAKNCIITPHNAWASKAARNKLLNILTENLKNFKDGRPSNVVHS